MESTPEPDLKAAIAKLTRAESDALLLRSARGEAGAVLALKKKLTHSLGERPPSSSQSRRSAEELFEQAHRIEVEAKRQAQTEAERQRSERLEELACTEESVWAKIENLLGQKRGSAYDEATKLLQELKDMSEYKQRQARFAQCFQSIREQYGKSAALIGRFRRTGLM